MAEVVLFHSILGLRPGVIAAADRLRAAGHTVHTPDLFDGEVFDDLDDGMRKKEALGYQEIARRAREAAKLPAALVYAGFSMGATYAELLAASRPGALGAVLMHGAESVEALSEFIGVERWPPGVPVQVHLAAEDPWVEAEEVGSLGDDVRGPGLPSRSTSTPARATSSPTRTCPSTIAPRPRRYGDGCSPSSIGSTLEDRASEGSPGSQVDHRSGFERVE